MIVEAAARAGHGDGVFREGESGSLPGGGGFQHAVAGLGRASGLGDDDGEGAAQASVQAGQDEVHAFGVGVVEKVDGHFRNSRSPKGL